MDKFTLYTDFIIKITPIHKIQTNEHDDKIHLTTTFAVSLNCWVWFSFIMIINAHNLLKRAYSLHNPFLEQVRMIK